MTLNEFAILMLREHSESIDDTDFITVVEEWTKDALAEMADACNWRFFQSVNTIVTVPGTAIYDLPTGVNQVRAFRMSDVDEEITYKDIKTLIHLNQDLERQERPRHWFYRGQTLSGADQIYQVTFFPVPDQVYTITGSYRFDPTLITSSDHLPLQQYLMLLLKDRVRSYLLADDKDYDGADRAYQRFLTNLDKAVRKENAKENNRQRFQQRDISSRGTERALARLDPSHFG